MAVITFDDGFPDFQHTGSACPVLRRHGFSATMYLPTAFIYMAGNHLYPRLPDMGRNPRLPRGIEFGAHTVSHPDLYDLPWQDIDPELTLSKEHIEPELDGIRFGFAYPYAFPQQDPQFVDQFKKGADARKATRAV